MAESEEQDYHFYGTPLEDEQEGRASAYRRPVKDPAQIRTLPIWKQEATDEQGRKRFHGAFTGGFSAGYYNSVGSSEGFQPASFKSSRSSRQAVVQQSVDDFLDEDEREARSRTVLTVKNDYDTFGTVAADTARSAAQREAQQRPSLIPGPIIEELVVPVASGVGMRLLQKLGWRPGKGVGTAAPSRQAEEAGSKWGSVAGVSLENTPLYVLEPKADLHGLGYDPFEGAEEFRQAAKRRKVAERGSAGGGAPGEGAAGGASNTDRGTGGSAAQRRGRIAFGTGVLEDTDTFGYLEDYVEEVYDEPQQRLPGGSGDGRQGPRGLTGAAVGALGSSAHDGGGGVARHWEQLALSYEVVSEGESDDDGRGGPARWARGHGRAPDSLIPGFRPSRSSSACGVVVPEYFLAPEVPPDFSGRHVFPAGLRAGYLRAAFTSALPAAGAGSAASQSAITATCAVGGPPPPPPPPEVPPPTDPGLRREIEVLAAMVARSGSALEQIARKQAAAAAAGGAGAGVISGGDGAKGAVEGGGRTKYSFFLTGEGLQYYLWRLHKIQTALAAVNAGPQPHRATPAAAAAAVPPSEAGPANAAIAAGSAAQRPAGGRPEPLTVEQRMAMLGEQPLPATAAGTSVTAAAAGGGAPTAAAAAAPSRPQVAEADRQHLQALLSSNFVRGEIQDLSTDSAPQTVPAEAAAAFLSRFTTGSSSETAVLQPDGAGGLQQQKAGKDGDGGGKQAQVVSTAPREEPLRSVEEWRPEPLVCKRFNVPDPYKGKPPPLQAPRFRTDLLALPETSNLTLTTTTTVSTSITIAAAAITTAPGPSQLLTSPTAAVQPLSLPPPPPLPAGPTSGLSAGVAAGPAAAYATAPPPGLSHTLPQGPLPGPPPLPRAAQSLLPAVATTSASLIPPTAGQRPPEAGGHSAVDAASAFLSAFGQSLFPPAAGGSGGGSADNMVPPLPLPPPPPLPFPSSAAAQPGFGLHPQSPSSSLQVLPAPTAPASRIPGVPQQDAAVRQVAQQQQPPPVLQDDDLITMPLDKPLDLFAAIFEAESEEEDEEEEGQGQEKEAGAGKHAGGRTGDEVAEGGPVGVPAAAIASGGGTTVGPAKSLAEALMRAQEVSAKRAQEARESRQAEALQEQLLAGAAPTATSGGAAAAAAAGGAVMAPGGILGPVDPEVQDRIRTALSFFQSHYRSKKDRSKDRKRKKEKKKQKDKDKGKEKEKKGKKERKRRGKDRDRDLEGYEDRDSKERHKKRRSKKGKKEKEEKDRGEGRGSKRRRSKRDEDRDGDGDVRRKEWRGKQREAAEETDEDWERERKRSRRSRQRSRSFDDDEISVPVRQPGGHGRPRGADGANREWAGGISDGVLRVSITGLMFRDGLDCGPLRKGLGRS
ncbi:hypothetical protein VOLCADRAFT_104208 [Volvox carteri f. nagariensis]|uniref:G-patch domain-containing protein n=1 Tax=Volvox carteri f. nagariensis TaxID=3068 RepID=D8TS46_VOLCA|nr:uncharacterized protein VOLCADRAFT_104208 [Volvox carteri f. nagariensis]EFJ49630.1 hypothetical protein VOLCADRAFT_104208 [Volvox carteri f. nagariensis]|eukprot:XP_002949137.1 hypothetical protein VOLCADRAFT_104208 [Volvox carteri f. nagariensis]